MGVVRRVRTLTGFLAIGEKEVAGVEPRGGARASELSAAFHLWIIADTHGRNSYFTTTRSVQAR